MTDKPKTPKIHPIQLIALLAMVGNVPRARPTSKPCLCGYGTFRDTHAANCDEEKGNR